jgi:transposase
LVFDGVESDGFDGGFEAIGRVFDTRKRVKGKSKADYRRVVVNFKSTKKYWQERSRRKQVVELFEQNLSITQVAAKLGVCERTVRRDLAKIEPFYKRRASHLLNQLEEAKNLEFEALSPMKQLKFLELKIMERDKMFEQYERREYCRHQLVVTFDLDDLSGGVPKITSMPKEIFSIKSPFRIDFAFKKNGETTQIQGLVIQNQT